MNLKLALLLSLPLLFALFTSSPAQADDATQARVLYQKGNAAFREGDDVMAREYYRRSLELQESFDTICNWGRAEARSKLHAEAYEHLRLCVHLYPDDKELADAKVKFAALRDEVRKELSFEQAKPIDDRVEAFVSRHEDEASDSASDGSQTDSAADAPPPQVVVVKRKWKLPVVLSLVGVGLVGGSVGTIMLVRSDGLSGEADDLRADLPDDACASDGPASECSEIKSKLEKSDTAFGVGVTSLVVGGTFLAGSLAVALLVSGTKTVSADRGSEVGTFHLGETDAGVTLRPFATVDPQKDGWHLGMSGSF
jgi:hypothetical protein